MPEQWQPRPTALRGSMTEIGKVLIVLGGMMLVVGVLLTLSGKIPWLGRLPGDIVIQRDNFSFYFPLTTCLLLSVLVSLIFAILRR
jgi:hypothetical protein